MLFASNENCTVAFVRVGACVRACVRACVGAWVRACVRACVRVCVHNLCSSMLTFQLLRWIICNGSVVNMGR